MEAFLPLLCLLLMYPYTSSSLPMCTSLRAPVIAKEALAFCPYKGRVCCDAAKDSQLQMQFEAMNISDPNCASAIKSILCATCDQFSSNLFKLESQIPLLCDCDSSLSATSSFCTQVWNTCQNVSMINSPFAPSLQGAAGLTQNTSSKLTDLWQSRTDFCTAFGIGGRPDDDDDGCFNGRPVQLNSTPTSVVPPKGLCLERLGDKGYINMAPHPDGSDRAFFSDLPGKIWLASIPTHASGEPLGIDESTPFVDLTDQIKYDTVFGLMGMAFHPNFTQNGRFFASFNCDKETSTTCSGRCGCNSDVGCDPSKIGADHPCQYHNVVAEYTVNGTSSSEPTAKATPAEVRRILTIGLPFTNNHGGQILFGPEDGYLYIMLGDGGGRNGPYRLAQNKKSLLGKIMRVDVDTIPEEGRDDSLNVWGNYSIPRDNPYSEDKELLPEIWALGLRNPWRCSFDSQRPSYFLCTDVGQDRYEEIDVITKGGNYGWSTYEGHLPVDSSSSKENTSDSASDLMIFPAMGYNHYDVNKKEGSAAITGGSFYRSTTDPCMYGSYLYADLYATALWAAAETPTNSGNFTSTSIPFGCARDSPLQCNSVPNTNLAALGYIYSFGEDNKKDVYILASTGVYRVVQPSRCNYSCTKEKVQSPTTPTSSSGEFVICISLILVLVGGYMLLQV